MGFSEFERVQRQLSTSLIGFDDVESIDGDDNVQRPLLHEEDNPQHEEQGDNMSRVRAQSLWKQSVQKVMIVNRFNNVTQDKLRRDVERILRVACYHLPFSVISCSFETINARAGLGLALLPQGKNPVLNLCTSGAACMLLRSLTRDVAGCALALWSPFSRPKAVRRAENSWVSVNWFFLDGFTWSRAGYLGQYVLHKSACYVAETAFYRKVILGQPLTVTLAGLGTASLNGLSAIFMQEVCLLGLDLLYRYRKRRQAIGEKEDQDDEQQGWFSVAQFVSYEGIREIVSYALNNLRVYVGTSAPLETHPVPTNVFTATRELCRQRGGVRGLFRGFFTCAALVPLTTLTAVATHSLLALVLGPSRENVLQKQVDEVRESLELDRHVPVEIQGADHMRAIVRMAASRERVLILLIADDEKESKNAIVAAHHFCETQPNATFIYGRTTKLQFLRDFARDFHIPCFIPIVDGQLDVENIMFFHSSGVAQLFLQIDRYLHKKS